MFRKNGKLYLDDIDIITLFPVSIAAIFGAAETHIYGHPGYLTLGVGVMAAATLAITSYSSRYMENKFGKEYGTGGDI